MDLIKTLQNLEPIFIQAGKLALKMQKGIDFHNKFNTGNPAADIVTEADLAVQEFLLSEIIKTDLINCCLLAEENTISTKEFNEQGKYFLGIDPIDDTAIYAKGGDHFSTIISLHDGEKLLYMFIYFPAWDWIHKIVNNDYSVLGKTPDLPENVRDTIFYWSGDLEKNIPEKVLNELKSKGIKFSCLKNTNLGVGCIAMFATNKIAGIYQENPNVYDGLVEYNIASAKGLKIYSSSIDLTNIKKRETGLYYPGYYLALT